MTKASPDFCHMFKDLLDFNVKYCKLCLKTEAEIVLVQPTHLKNLLKDMKHIKLNVTNALVCIYCEARAAAVERFIAALIYARNAANLLAFAGNSAYNKEIQKYLNHQSTRSEIIKDLRHAVDLCEAGLDIPTSLNLCSTETLLIDLTTESNIKKKNETIECIKQDEIVISDSSDDECINLPMIHPKPIEQLLEKPVLQPKTVLPDVTLRDNVLLVNNLQNTTVKIPNNEFTPIASNDASQLLYIVSDNGRMTVHPLYKKNDNIYIIPDFSNKSDSIITNTNVFTNKSDSIITNTNVFTNKSDSIITNTNNGKDLPIITGAKSLNVSEEVMVVTNEELQGILRKRESQRSSEIEPGRKKAIVGTDWEDKIPMEVISFMDSSDPICAIESVRSVR